MEITIFEEYKELRAEKQLLEAKILDFYQKLRNRSYKMDTSAYTYKKIAEDFKERFNITEERHGRVGN